MPTAEGALYEVDTRLRPQGNQGPLAVSLESFARYQSEDAWTWEHMALCRSRPIFGSVAARGKLEEIVRGVLQAKRDPQQLRADVLKMRGDMAQHKPARGPLDVKLLRGGLVDCEFLVHYLQLRENIAFSPALEVAIAELAEAGLLPAEFAHWHAALTRLLVSARLLAHDGEMPPETARPVLARACGAEDFDSLLQKLEEARQGVAAQWQRHFDEILEMN